MNKRKLQSGSAHLIIIIILAVALLGTLSFVFWQNFVGTVENDDIVAITAETIELDQVAYDQTMGTGVAIRYPDSWTMSHKSGINADYFNRSEDLSTITSPDGAVEVKLYIYQPTGFGEECSNASLTRILDEGVIDGYESLGYRAFAEGAEWPDGSVHYKYIFGAFRSSVINDTDCQDYTYGHFLMNVPNINSDNGVVTLYMNFPDITEEVSGLNKGYVISNIDDLNQIIESDNYKIAKRIIESLHKI